MPETETWRYRGQTIDREQISFLREFIREHPHSSRWKLSRQLCEALGWKQANGALRDVVCRGLLLMLERAGEIELPPVRWLIVGQRRTARPRPEAVLIDTTPLAMPLGTLGAIEIQLVRRTADEPLFHSLMEQFHYLRYEQPVGEHLKYLVWAQGRPVACLAWSSAPRHLASRDRFIGWNGVAKTIRRIGRTGRSKRCWRFHSIAGFTSYCRRESEADGPRKHPTTRRNLRRVRGSIGRSATSVGRSWLPEVTSCDPHFELCARVT